MAIRPKTKRRVTILLVLVVLLGVAGIGGYAIRKRQIEKRFWVSREQGMAALAAGEHLTALHQLGRFLSRHPRDAKALYAYAQARRQVEETEGRHLTQTVAILRRVLDIEPGNGAAQHELLDLYVQIRFSTEALATAERLLQRDPGDVAAARAKAISLYRMRRFDEAIRASERHNELAPFDLEGQILTMQAMLGRGEPAEKVVARAEALRKAHPGDGRFELLQSIACLAASDIPKAKDWVHKAAVSLPKDSECAKALSRQLDALGLFNEAVEALRQAAKQPNAVEMQRALGARLLQMSRYQEVLDELKDPNGPNAKPDSELLGLRALAMIRLGQKSEARQLWAPLAERKSDRVAVAWSAVLPLLAESDYPSGADATRALESAILRQPQNPFFQYYLAEAYARGGESESAIEHWRRASAAAPSWAEPLIQMANLLTASGRVLEAIDAGKAAWARAPEDPRALMAVAMAGATGVRPDDRQGIAELLKLVAEIRRLSPAEEQIIPIEAKLLAMSGQQDAAIKAVQAALAAGKAIKEQTLLRLANVCRENNLGLEEACFEQSQKAHGLTPDLAYAKAVFQYSKGQATQGLQFLEQTYQQGGHDKQVDWRIVWARYLDLVQDERAKATWIALGDDLPDNQQVQWLALSARAVQGDREFRGRTIERLRGKGGEQGMNWRLARAQWLLQGAGGEKEMAEATSMLSDVSRSSPDLLAPRLLLANCFERLGNISGAIEQLSTAASLYPRANGIALELARLLQSQGDYERARIQIDRVLQNGNATAPERRTLSILLAQQGDAEQALKILQQSYGENQQPPDLVLASLYRQRGQNKEAEAIYRKLLEKPDGATIRAAADFFASIGRSKEAASCLARLNSIDLPPGTREIICGDYHLRQGSIDAAVVQFRHATTAAPVNSFAWQQLIGCHLLTGQAAEAIEACRQAAKSLPTDRAFDSLPQNESLVRSVASNRVARPLLVMLLKPDSSPAAIEALRVIDDGMRRQDSLEQVLLRLRPIAERNPRFMGLQLLLAEMYAANGKIDEAVTISTRTMKTFPTFAEPAEQAVRMLLAAGQWSEVLSVAQDWRNRTLAQPLPADLAIATSHLRTRKPALAVEQLAPYLALAKDDPEKYVLVFGLYSEAQISMGRVDGAASLLGPLLVKSAQWRALWIQLSGERISDPLMAAQWLEQVSSLIPESAMEEQIALAQGWNALAKRAGDAKLTERARVVLNAAAVAAQKTPDTKPIAFLALGMMHDWNGDLVAAEAEYRQVLRLDPLSGVALNNLAMILLDRDGDADEALTLAMKASKANPKIGQVYDTLACAYLRKKEYARAIESINLALRMRPDNSTWRLTLAQILLENGQHEKARAALGEVIALEPNEPRLNARDRLRLERLRAQLDGPRGSP